MAVSSEFDADLYIGVTGTNGGGHFGRAADIGSVCDSSRRERTNVNQYRGWEGKSATAFTADVRSFVMLNKHTIILWLFKSLDTI